MSGLLSERSQGLFHTQRPRTQHPRHRDAEPGPGSFCRLWKRTPRPYSLATALKEGETREDTKVALEAICQLPARRHLGSGALWPLAGTVRAGGGCQFGRLKSDRWLSRPNNVNVKNTVLVTLC